MHFELKFSFTDKDDRRNELNYLTTALQKKGCQFSFPQGFTDGNENEVFAKEWDCTLITDNISGAAEVLRNWLAAQNDRKLWLPFDGSTREIKTLEEVEETLMKEAELRQRKRAAGNS